jgi:Oxidoreductase molybdopterin binding domain
MKPIYQPKHRHHYVILSVAILLTGISAAFSADSVPVVHVDGAVTRPGDWTVARLHDELSADIKPIKYTSKGQEHTCNCVPLISVLKAAGVPIDLKMGTDPKTKNAQLHEVVIITGRDGYAVDFSLAELLPDIGNRAVWLALDMDGQPIAPADGPMKVLVPDDAKPGRWVRQLASISVMNTATSQPAN